MLRKEEELASIRPELDGAQIMAELVVKPGPVVGETYRFLLDLRMERGPLGEKPARQALRSWWVVRGESRARREVTAAGVGRKAVRGQYFNP